MADTSPCGFALLVAAGSHLRQDPLPSRRKLSLLTGSVPNQASPAPTSSSRSNVLLEELKNQLFQLEVERKQGRIAQPEYERARAGLERTLKQAIKRAPRT